MSTYIEANVSKMFSHREPWDVSNSVANLGPRAAELTWACALEIADDHASWLMSDLGDAVEGMRDWAKDTGAWDAEERGAWSDVECLALFVQNVAGELRMLGSDNADLDACAIAYHLTDWDSEPEYPIGSYDRDANGVVTVSYYTGC